MAASNLESYHAKPPWLVVEPTPSEKYARQKKNVSHFEKPPV